MCHRQLLPACCAVLWLAAGAAGTAVQGRPRDVSVVAARLDLTETGVRKWLERLGATVLGASTERLLAVSLTGTLLLDRGGGSSFVQLGPELDTLLRAPDASIVLIHNHPAGAGLSAADISQLAKPGVAAIVAIGHDGSVFVAGAGPNLDRDFFEERQYPAARAEVFERLRSEWPSRLSVAASDAHLSHLVMLALDRAAIVDYWFELRGANRESFETARIIFGRVVAGAAARLRKNAQRDRPPARSPDDPRRGVGQPSATPLALPFEPAPVPYIVIRVPVAGGPCEALIFDTGTNTTVLAPALAARAGLTAGLAAHVEAVNRTAPAIKGEVRGIGFDGVPPPGPRIAVATDVSALGGIGRSIAGIYGHNWLTGTDYLIDYEAKRILLGSMALPRSSGRDRLPLTWIDERPAVRAAIRAHAVEPYDGWFVLDSGADHVTLFGDAADRLTLAADLSGTMVVDDGFARREVPAASITIAVAGIERSVRVEVRSDIRNRGEDGLLPTSLFRQVLVSASEGNVVFNRRVPVTSGAARRAPCGA